LLLCQNIRGMFTLYRAVDILNPVIPQVIRQRNSHFELHSVIIFHKNLRLRIKKILKCKLMKYMLIPKSIFNQRNYQTKTESYSKESQKERTWEKLIKLFRNWILLRGVVRLSKYEREKLLKIEKKYRRTKENNCYGV